MYRLLRWRVVERVEAMIILGIILLVVGILLKVMVVEDIGILLLVIGVILWILGAVGRPVAGRKVWF